jgi:hypothetical protein
MFAGSCVRRESTQSPSLDGKRLGVRLWQPASLGWLAGAAVANELASEPGRRELAPRYRHTRVDGYGNLRGSNGGPDRATYPIHGRGLEDRG